jgi:putative PEP-CTERM system TPR-repeat lipoprotein
MSHTQRYHSLPGKAWFVALSALLILPACGIGMDNADRLERGQQAFESGDFRTAIIEGKNILQSEPDNVGARLLLGRSSLRLGDPRSAEKELRKAIELGVNKSDVVVDLGRALLILREFEQVEAEITPDIASDEETRIAVLRIRGDALLAQRRAPEARAIYQEMLAVRDNDLDTMLAVVTSYVAQNELFQARATLDQILTIDPEYVAGWLASGSLAALQQDLAQAERNFARGAELAAEQSDLAGQLRGLTGVAEAQLAQRKGEEARLTAAKLSALAPENPFNEYLAARAAYVEEDWVTAEAALQTILQRSPEYVPARVLLGGVQLERGNLTQAAANLSIVTYSVPENLVARKLMAEVRLRQNRPVDASRLLEPVLGSGSADAMALTMAVRANLGAGEFDEAIRNLRARIEAEPDNPNLQMDLASVLLTTGEVEEAQVLLQDLSVISEDDAYRRELLLVLAPVRNEDFEAALVAARAAQERWDDDPKILNLLGGILDASGDRVAARQSFEAARALDSTDIVSLINLARLDINAGNFESAYQLYEQALEIQPQNVGILVSLGRVASFQGEAATAIGWLEKARETDSSNVASRVLLGRLYVATEDFTAAEEVAREAIALNADIAELHNTLGMAAAGRSDYYVAEESFQKAIELKPDEPGYSINLARLNVGGGREDLAEAVLFTSMKAEPDHVQTALLLASLYARSGDAAEKLPAALDLQQQHPESVGPLILLAELYFDGEQYEQAFERYDRALESSGNRDVAIRAYQLRQASGQARPEAPLLEYLTIRPEDSDVRMVLALEYQAQGKEDDARNEYIKIVDASPTNYVALNNLALIYLDRGNTEAEALARRASELAPQNGAIADTLGWILVRTGTVDEGVEYLRKAVELISESSEIQYHLAVGLAESGETDEARTLLNKILAVDDSFTGRGDAEALLSNL